MKKTKKMLTVRILIFSLLFVCIYMRINCLAQPDWGVGGLASPLGGAMNLVVVDYIQKLTGHEYMYGIWVMKFLPIMIILIVSNLLFMIRDIGKYEKLGGSKEYFIQKQNSIYEMNFEKKCLLGLFLAATAAIAVPVVISIIQGIGKDPLPYIYIVTIGVNLSYMFPTSIRAIPVGYGLNSQYMLSEGWKMSVMVIVEMTILCYFLLRVGFL